MFLAIAAARESAVARVQSTDKSARGADNLSKQFEVRSQTAIEQKQ